MKNLFFILFLILFSKTVSFGQLTSINKISLAGEWNIALDANYKDWPRKIGEERKWYKNKLPSNESLSLLNKIYFKNAAFLTTDKINLPGSTDEAKIGSYLEFSNQFSQGLERNYTYDGAFWIQKEVIIPNDWAGKTVIFSMERVLGTSKVFWDETEIGKKFGYACPHEFIIDKKIKAGKHRLTVLIDKNEIQYPHQGHHVFSANGTSWNGVIGEITLTLKNNENYIKNTFIYPKINNGGINVKVNLTNENVKNKKINFYLKKKESKKYIFVNSFPIKDSISVFLPIPKPMVLWNEFTPNLYELKAEILQDDTIIDTTIESFGMREIGKNNGYITINGDRVFMRGTLDCGSFPLKGYPFMKKEEWLQVLKTNKEYGINHIRFHTWCPPKAAFDAADELGMYLQPELPGTPYVEINNILDTYGNHPSFCMLSLNNENSHNEVTTKVISDAKNKDNRHLYTCTSQPVKPDCIDDFYVSAWGNKSQNDWPGFNRIVGITWGGGDVVHSSRFNINSPETYTDYSQDILGINAPIVSHEIGQWAMFPHLNEIKKYSGVLRNTNYERIKNTLEQKNMLQQAQDFAEASGKFSSILYKEEIESALRTPGFAGFQLLGLNDYQGQGISIVGMLDSFWETKGIITPKQHKEYCNTITPLAKMKKRVWQNNEKFSAEVVVANYSLNNLKNIKPIWKIISQENKIIATGVLNSNDVIKGGLSEFSKISFPLNKILQPAKLKLIIDLSGVEFQNSWDFWVYPLNKIIEPKQVHLLKGNQLEEVFNLLEKGEKVLLQLDNTNLKNFRESCFSTIFWNSTLKWPQKAHTLGILCNPENPIFENFVTEKHSDWQWWDIAMNAYAMNIDNLPEIEKPHIQVIDSYTINEKLAYLWECNIGKGKLMVSSINFSDNLEERPSSKQLLLSVLEYMNTDKFNPEVNINKNQLLELIK